MSEKLLVPDIGEFEKVEVIELLVKLGDQIELNESVNVIVGVKVCKGVLLFHYFLKLILYLPLKFYPLP